MYISFKLVALIEKPYRVWFDKLLNKQEKCKFCEVCLENTYLVKTKDTSEHLILHKARCKILEHLKLLWGDGGYFNVQKCYDKDSGLFITGHKILSNKTDIEKYIKHYIVPYANIKEYYTYCHTTSEYDIDETNENELHNYAFFINCDKHLYSKKHIGILNKVNSDSSFLHKKMKEYLIKDIEAMLARYKDYNLNVTELRKSFKYI